MEFPKLENAEQARVLGLMMSERGLEMLVAEHQSVERKIQDSGEHGDEEMENRLHLFRVACTEFVRNSGPLTRQGLYDKVRRAQLYQLRPDMREKEIEPAGGN
jgi:hypothetical protein